MQISRQIFRITVLAALMLFPMLLPAAALGQAKESSDSVAFFTSGDKPVVARQSGQQIVLANRQVGLEITQGLRGFYVSRLYGIGARQDFLRADSAEVPGPLWQLKMRRDKGRDTKGITLTSLDGGQLSSTIDSSESQVTVHLYWKNLAVADQPEVIDVEVTVTVRQGDPLSRWRINVVNRSKTLGIWEVVFPIFDLAPVGKGAKTNHLVIPKYRGVVGADPFNNPDLCAVLGLPGGRWYPGSMNMQFNALYDDSGVGVYMVTEDGQGYAKRFYAVPNPAKQIITYKVGHYPDNMGYPAENYSMTYDACIGPFTGDWYDACQIYRNWATQQVWCSKGPLLTRKDIPKWFKEAPLKLKASTKRPEDLPVVTSWLITMLYYIDMELPVVWYDWKLHLPLITHYNKEGSPYKVPDGRPYTAGNIHDGNYPALPALPGIAASWKAIKQAGGHVEPYVCSRIYDQGLDENAPYAAAAKPSVARKVDGSITYCEAGDVAWEMCYHSKWWQNRMAETVVALIENENAGGIYFDTFYGGNVECFDTSHGHSACGGNSMYMGSRKLSAVVRGAMKKADPESFMGGESPAETAIDLLDDFLLRSPVWPEMKPLMTTIYGDYICRVAPFMAPDSKGFFIQAASLFTTGTKMGRLRFQMNYDGLWMSQYEAGVAYGEHMKFLRKLCHYWKQDIGGRFLAYGKFLRPIEFTTPDPMPTSSYTEYSKYLAYKGGLYMDGLITEPSLINSVYKSHDGDLGIFIVNVTDKPLEFGFELTPDRYPISKSTSYDVTAIDETGKRSKTTLQKGKIAYSGKIAGYDVLFLGITEHKNHHRTLNQP